MVETVVHRLGKFGQSIWLDYISRSLIDRGKLREMINLGLRGMTSNPTIFDKAVSSSPDYDGKISALVYTGKSTFEIYDELTVKDVQDAADIFMPVYEDTEGLDGYVSLEVNPKLAYNAQDTVKEARRLHQKVNRPNVMFKVPSTKEGFSAIEELIASGININITLIFSLGQYTDTANAYIKGLSRLAGEGGDISKVRSVASVFVSRVDTKVDKLLEDRIADAAGRGEKEELSSLRGKAAVANCRLIYRRFREICSSQDFKKLKAKRANIQRVLWGSTSTKNPAYSDIKYVTELTGKDTVNTIPQNTFEAFLDHGEARDALGSDYSSARMTIDNLRKRGIDVDEVCEQLLKEGVIAFERSFDSLLHTIEEKRKKLCSRL